MNKNNLPIKIILIISLLFFLSLSLSAVNAVNLTLNPNDSINDAVSNINTNGSTTTNNTITLTQGTYNKSTDRNNNVTINNINLTIKGNGKVIIDAQKSGRIFTITGNSNIKFINITFINGNAYDGGAIYIKNGTTSITDCKFDNNNATRGGAIFNTANNLTIFNSSFDSNIAKHYGGAIQSEGGDLNSRNYGNTSIINSFFINNKVTELQGGAINIWHYNCTVINSTFNSNNAQDGGGAIEIYNYANLTVIDSKFDNNSANCGGAICTDSGFGFCRVINSKFTNNKATGNYGGGAIFNVDTTCIVIDSTFINNSAIKGGAIHTLRYAYHTNITVNNSKFVNNTANYGGGIYITNSPAFIIGSNFTGNGQAIHINGEIFQPYLSFNSLNVKTQTLNGSAGIGFYGNDTQLNGTTVFIINSNFINNNQAIFINNINTTIIGCNIINNIQGIYVTNSSINTTINYNRIFNNSNYDLNVNTSDANADFNWWGNNNPTKIIGINPNNHFVMNVSNLTSLDSNGAAIFNYTFQLNDNSIPFDVALLPYFTTEAYTNITSGIITFFDARYDNIFDVTINTSGNVLYNFITDNEVQILEGTITVSDPNDPNDLNDSVDSKDFIDPDAPLESIDLLGPNDSNIITETSNNLTPKAASMKKTGIPTNIIILFILSVLGLLIRRK